MSHRLVPPAPHPSFANFDSPRWREGETEKERDTLEEFRRMVLFNADQPLTPEDRAFCDDACLVRFLRARDYKCPKSLKMLQNCLNWRHEYNPLEILPDEDLASEASWGRMYMDGFDLLHRPVVYSTASGKSSENWDMQIRYLVYNFENTIASMDVNRNDQLLWLTDYSNFSMFCSPPIKVTKAIMNILMNYYPERLGGMFLVDNPFYLQVLWKMLSPFINKVTKEKMHFVRGSPEKKRENLTQYIGPQELETWFHGDNSYSYNHEEYWKRTVHLHEERQRLWSEKVDKAKEFLRQERDEYEEIDEAIVQDEDDEVLKNE